VLGEGELLVAARATLVLPNEERHLLRLTERFGAAPLTTLRLRFPVGEGAFTSSSRGWWYTVAGNHQPNRWGIAFVEWGAENEVRTAFVGLPLGVETIWLPLAAPAPQGVSVAQTAARDGVVLSYVTPGGVKNSWTVPRPLEVRPRQWSAQLLPDGTIAVVAIEGTPDAPARVVLHLLDPHGASAREEIVLAESLDAWDLNSAVEADGALAVVVRNASGIRGAIVDPHLQTAVHWRLLSESGESVSYPRVISAEPNFVVAWTSSRAGALQLRARTLKRKSADLAPTTIATVASRSGKTPFFTAISDEDELLFFWQSDGLVTRRLPSDLGGYALLAAIHECFCAAPRQQP
nr:hypothetical protein [Acidobacteriota bacterium]